MPVLAMLIVPIVARAQDDATQPDPEEAEDDGAGTPSAPPVDDAFAAGAPVFETVVVGRRPASRDATQAATQVGGQDLRDSPRGSVLEALSQETADVYVPGRGAMHGVASGASGGIHVRGLGGSPNSQVLVVEDGVPDYQGIFGHPIPDAYVPFLLEDALIVKGGDSVLYGTNAMGGVVVLRSRRLGREGHEISNDAAYGSYSTLREAAAALGRFGDWDVAGAFLGLQTDGHRDGAGGNALVGQAAVRRRLARNLELALRNKVVHLEGADPGPVTHPTPDHWYDVWRNNTSVQLAWNNDDLALTVTPFFNVGVHRLYDGFESFDHVGGGIATLDLPLLRTADLLVGLAAQHVGGEVDNRITGERPHVQGLTDVSFYGQLTLRPVEALTLVFGTRELFSTTCGAVTLYKAGARWTIFDDLYVRTRVTRNFRQPTIRELYLPFPTANPDLRPEYARAWDVTIGYDTERFAVSCTAYHTEADDLIKYFGAWPAAEVVNIDHVAIWGVEGRIGLTDLGPVSLLATADWRDVGRYTRQNPEAKLNFTLEAGHEFGAHFVGGSLTGEWVHGLYMANYGRRPIPDVFAADLALRYRYSSPDRGFTLEPYVFLRNFLDRRYAYIAHYPMPGFNVLVGLKVGL